MKNIHKSLKKVLSRHERFERNFAHFFQNTLKNKAQSKNMHRFLTVLFIFITPAFAVNAKASTAIAKTSRNAFSFQVSDNSKPPEDKLPANDLKSVDVQVTADTLQINPILNVITVDEQKTYRGGDGVHFLAITNYPTFVKKAEIRIYDLQKNQSDAKPNYIVPILMNGQAEWFMPTDGGNKYRYILRVYDANGQFDETLSQELERTEIVKVVNVGVQNINPVTITEDRTAKRNIIINGTMVTLYGSNVPAGYEVSAFGDKIPVDRERKFLLQRIVEAGEHNIDVMISRRGDSRDSMIFQRHISVSASDWFYVGLMDLTIGKRSGDDHIEDVRSGEYQNLYAEGQVALYVKGKIKGKYLLTAASDTGYDDLDQLLRGLDGKNPRQLLKRIDPNRYYPVYGDDSTYKEDAPTNGKFYVRIERNDSSAMWGNYKTDIGNTEFLHQSRGLYGASGIYRSEATTKYKEKRTEINAYAAQPETLPLREQFLGTGGSIYFLQKQDIVEGSETLTVEVREPITGRVISRKTLTYGQDYSINYIQGLIMLKQPLSSSTDTGSAVVNNASGGNNNFLLVEYEYEPLTSDVDGYIYGGRVQHWLNDNVRVGLTATKETTGIADQLAYGADVEVRKTETTYVKAEIARSSGPGFGFSSSTDGGLTNINSTPKYDQTFNADAWRMQGQVDLADIPALKTTGTIGGYYEYKDANFSTLYETMVADRREWGLNTQITINESTSLNLSYDSYDDEREQAKREGNAEIIWFLKYGWRLSAGLGYTYLEYDPTLPISNYRNSGDRLDAGGRITKELSEGNEIYVFAQGTVEKSGNVDDNDRGGVGGKWKVTDHVGVNGEVSYGTHGIGGAAYISYDPNLDDHYYFGYRLDPNRAFDIDRTDILIGSDKGVLVGGVSKRVDDRTTAYTENTFDVFGQKNTLAQSYGLLFAPDDIISIDSSVEFGRIRGDAGNVYDSAQSDFDRIAPSVSLNYKNKEEGIVGRVRGEVRIENSEDQSRDQNTYLFSANLGVKTSEDWRMLTSVNTVFSDSGPLNTSFQDTEYLESIIGFAYRPVENNRLNALFRYNLVYDILGEGQLKSGATDDPYAVSQKSHIFSADVSYEVNEYLTLGGKYGMRYGKIKYNSDDENLADLKDWQSATAHLGIFRADITMLKSWDFLLEARVLSSPDAKTVDYGSVLALYRQFGDNFKAGFGYNFGSFSDDLRDVTLNDQGWFFNLVGML